jgi:hypothetical protein
VFDAAYLCRATGFCLVDAAPMVSSRLAAPATERPGGTGDIELRYHSNQVQLQGWAGPEAIKMRFAAQLAERYQRERNPYVQKLSELQHLMDRMAFRH